VKILGLILLIIGLIGGLKACTSTLPTTASHSYNVGHRLGRLTAAIVFIGAGLWLLRRGGGRTQAPIQLPARRPGKLPAAPPLPAVMPDPVPVNIRCGCGRDYSLEIQPVAGSMPEAVACPSCGADGTDVAKRVIAQANVARAKSPAWPTRGPAAWRKLHPALLMGVGVVALLLVFYVAVVGSRYRPRRTAGAAPISWKRPDGARPQPGRAPRHGTLAESSPVPANVTAVEVFWGGGWWPATIVRREGRRAYIHYDGFASSSDEWVTPERLRPRRQTSQP
jgi:hypothetical protein